MKHSSEGERLAGTLVVAHAQLKNFLAISRSGVPQVLLDIMLHSQSEITVGHLNALCLDIFFLYDKCIKAGVVDQSAVDSAYLADMREGLSEFKESNPTMPMQSAEDTLKELHALTEHVCAELDRHRAKMPSADDVIGKARK